MLMFLNSMSLTFDLLKFFDKKIKYSSRLKTYYFKSNNTSNNSRLNSTVQTSSLKQDDQTKFSDAKNGRSNSSAFNRKNSGSKPIKSNRLNSMTEIETFNNEERSKLNEQFKDNSIRKTKNVNHNYD